MKPKSLEHRICLCWYRGGYSAPANLGKPTGISRLDQCNPAPSPGNTNTSSWNLPTGSPSLVSITLASADSIQPSKGGTLAFDSLCLFDSLYLYFDKGKATHQSSIFLMLFYHISF